MSSSSSKNCTQRGNVRTARCFSRLSAAALPLEDSSVLTFEENEWDFVRLVEAWSSANFSFMDDTEEMPERGRGGIVSFGEV